ncbi:MAG: histidine kinase, partial [Planctomycetota bacterium JB042]
CSSDLPVRWNQIGGAKVIVEDDFEDVPIAPSQGSHFFHNITASGVGYFTVGGAESVGEVDWEWLSGLRELERRGAVRRIRLDEPLTVLMDGAAGRGVILRP